MSEAVRHWLRLRRFPALCNSPPPELGQSERRAQKAKNGGKEFSQCQGRRQQAMAGSRGARSVLHKIFGEQMGLHCQIVAAVQIPRLHGLVSLLDEQLDLAYRLFLIAIQGT